MGTETLALLAMLICSGLCCLGMAVLLLVGVVFALRNANANGDQAMSFWPFARSEPAEGAPGSEPSIGALPAPTPSLAGSEPGLGPAPSSPVFVEEVEAPTAPKKPSRPQQAPRAEPPRSQPPRSQPPDKPRASGQTIIAFDDDDDEWS